MTDKIKKYDFWIERFTHRILWIWKYSDDGKRIEDKYYEERMIPQQCRNTWDETTIYEQ